MIPARSWFIIPATAVLATLAACESSTLSDPGASASRSAAFARSSGGGPSCTITLPAPAVRPLPAVREVARELNEAFGKSPSVTCGVINGIDQRFNTLVSMLDRADADQNLDAACGIATGLTNELQALEGNGRLNPIVTHPPQAGPNVVENMAFITSEFCRNAGR